MDTVGGHTALPPPPPPPLNRPLPFAQQQQQQQQQPSGHGVPPPPPPPPQQETRRRFPTQPPTLLTSVAASHLYPQQTPASAHPGHSPFSPAVAASPMAARGTLVSTYNPREWNRGGPVGGSYMPHTASPQAERARAAGTREMTGLEAALPSPPPPYSVSPSSQSPAQGTRQSPYQSISQAVSPTNHPSEYNTPISAATTSSSGSQPYSRSFAQPLAVTPSQQSSPTNFPPPPASIRDRSGSRSRFNLSAFTSRARALESSSPSNAMDTLQQQTTEAIARAPHASRPTAAVLQAALQPPGARRAASTGAIGPGSEYVRRPDHVPSSSSPDQNHGYALPPPPPGPPPNGSRSQSLSRSSDMDRDSVPRPNPIPTVAPRRGAAQSSQLGPVPPTPADWIDGEPAQTEAPPMPQLPSHAPAGDGHASMEPVGANTSALREPFPRIDQLQRELSNGSGSGSGIRERRSQSRANRNGHGRSVSREPQTAIEQTSNPWAADAAEARPANLVLQSSNGVLSRRRHVSKSKTSPLFRQAMSPDASRRRGNSDETAPTAAPAAPHPHVEQTPPFSAGHEHGSQAKSLVLPDAQLRGLPTPNSARTTSLASPPVHSARSVASDRPISSLLTSPPAAADSPAISRMPSRPNSAAGKRVSSTLLTVNSSFGQSSLERYHQFLEQEASVATDQERLELFADFIVYESRLRRDRYAGAFEAMGGDVLELTRDMWKPLVSRRTKTPTSAPAANGSVTPNPPSSRQGSGTPVEPLSAGSAPYTPRTEPDSPANVARTRSDSRQNSYQPCLSPIPSMAVSTVRDEESSRGRAPSRWWEASSHPSESVGGARRVERSKRESKYMGLPREARENLQWDGVETQSPAHASHAGSSSQQYAYGPNEYPPEKTGWHEQAEPASATYSQPQQTPRTPKVPRLDVSRLINLPPPYPRHHPAVNNSHPDLGSTRSTLREISAREDGEAAAALYKARPKQASMSAEASNERKRELRRRIHEKVTNGEMSYAEAAKAEDEFGVSEAALARTVAQKDFDDFQAMVRNTLNSLYTERINSATAAIDQLSESLSEAARSHDPNQTQEEGDEKPELLEKLTLMKWLFEAREQLHLDNYQVEGESDDKYKHVILLPYKLAGAEDKVQEVESFFLKDSNDRRTRYEAKALKRYETFLQVVEKNVTRGVEIQLSAFWDIAPSLLELVQRVPTRLEGFAVEIPHDEYEENPAYNEFPLQYLFTLLLHTEKSAYQFIESQTNLLCLLHEVKTGVMSAGSRLLETERYLAGEEAATVREEMQAAREGEDARLTSDLKERVQLVEEQWKDALGNGLLECKTGVQAFLVQQGGWDESLME